MNETEFERTMRALNEAIEASVQRFAAAFDISISLTDLPSQEPRITPGQALFRGQKALYRRRRGEV